MQSVPLPVPAAYLCGRSAALPLGRQQLLVSRHNLRELTTSMTMAAAGTFMPAATPGSIQCCLCGVVIQPNPTNMCVECLRNQVDITEGVQKQVTITYCKACGRYLQPPRHWMPAELESKELLTFCIKRIKGLQKVKLVDAGFIWTEPHSKRLKVKLTVQAEVMNGAVLQQTFVVDFQVEWNMCIDCNRANTNVNAWKAVVQVRRSRAQQQDTRSQQSVDRSSWRSQHSMVAAHTLLFVAVDSAGRAGAAARGPQAHLHVPRAAHSQARRARAVHQHQGDPPGHRLLLRQPRARPEVHRLPAGMHTLPSPSQALSSAPCDGWSLSEVQCLRPAL